MQVNFKNYNPNGTADISKGISIYNQRYKLSSSLNRQLTLDDIKEIIEKIIVLDREGIEFEIIRKDTSNPFVKFKYSNGIDQGTVILENNQIMVFECRREIESNNETKTYYSYYCYFKDDTNTTEDNKTNGNVWLIYITLEEVDTETGKVTPFPVFFDLQDDLQPTFSGRIENDIVEINSCSTGNFDIRKVGEEFVYSNIKLKNTSFNLSYEEKVEDVATIEPIGGFTIKQLTPP